MDYLYISSAEITSSACFLESGLKVTIHWEVNSIYFFLISLLASLAVVLGTLTVEIRHVPSVYSFVLDFKVPPKSLMYITNENSSRESVLRQNKGKIGEI